MDTDRNLLFGVLALQTDLIDATQFAEACGAWATRKDVPLAEILVERGWLAKDDREQVEKLMERKLRRHGGDVRASLAAVADVRARDIIKSINDSDVQKSMSSLPPAAGHVLIESMPGPVATLLPQHQERSRYTLTRLHGEGGLGKVWIARDQDLNREVALKELQPALSKHLEAWRRFLKEAQVTGQLEHPNIVPVYELTRRREDNQPFYTMKFVRGQTLAEAIREYHQRGQGLGVRGQESATDTLEFRRLLGAFVSVANAIAYAHSRGVVHRDLKPANVVLGGFGEVIVLDWGLAKVAGAADPHVQTLGISEDARTEETRAGAHLGTPAYMAPEQAEGRRDLIDSRTDIYGLGTNLFEILTGRPPHDGANTAELLRGIINEPTPRARDKKGSRESGVGSSDSGALLPTPHSLLPPLPLDAVCFKAMSKSRDDRYATATELAEDVQRYLADEPVSCYREPRLVRARRWMKRHPTLLVSTAATVLISLASLAAIAALVGQSNRSLAAKNSELDRKNSELEQANQRERDATALALENAREAREQSQIALKSYERLGDVQRQSGQVTEALGSYQKGLEIGQKLAATPSPLPLSPAAGERGRGEGAHAQRDMSVLYAKLGDVQVQSGQVTEALRSYEKGQEIREKLAAADATDAQVQRDLWVSYYTIGEVERAAKQYQKALAWYEKAAAKSKAMQDAGRLAAGDENILIILDGRIRQCKHAATALGDWKTLLEQPAELLPVLLDLRGTELVKEGRTAEAVQAVAKLRELGTATAGQLYNAACVYSLCAAGIKAEKDELTAEQAAERQRHIDHALETLHEAIKAGYKNFAHMQKDPDLTVLRDLPEFKALLPK